MGPFPSLPFPSLPFPLRNRCFEKYSHIYPSKMKCMDRPPQRVDILPTECCQLPLGSSVSTSFDDGEHFHCNNCTCQSGGVLSCQPKQCQQDEHTPCYLTDGRKVADGFVGLDFGHGYCNLCKCEKGVLDCVVCDETQRRTGRFTPLSTENGSN